LELTGDYDARPVMTWIHEGRVDGLIVARPRRRERPIVKAALDAGLDVSLVLPDDAPRGARALRLDNEMGAAAAAEHLLALGHRRSAFFGGPESSVDSQGRLRGLRRSALEVAKRQVLHLGDFTVQAGARAAARYLSWRAKGSAPSAVVLANDAMALGFMRSVQVAGLRVPNDVSVVGFDGVPEGGLAVPALTTVLQPTHDIGFDACRLLLDDAPEVRSGRYPMELLVRESTAAPPKPGSG
jgi:LacI family transcriptional regulator